MGNRILPPGPVSLCDVEVHLAQRTLGEASREFFFGVISSVVETSPK
jgi:hypothetical protein